MSEVERDLPSLNDRVTLSGERSVFGEWIVRYVHDTSEFTSLVLRHERARHHFVRVLRLKYAM